MYVVGIIHGRSLDWLFMKFLGKQCNVAAIWREYSSATWAYAHVIVCAYYRASKPFRISAWFRQPSSKRDLPSSLATEHVSGIARASASLTESPKTLVFANIWFIPKFERVTPSEVDLWNWGVYELAILAIFRHLSHGISETVQDSTKVAIDHQ